MLMFTQLHQSTRRKRFWISYVPPTVFIYVHVALCSLVPRGHVTFCQLETPGTLQVKLYKLGVDAGKLKIPDFRNLPAFHRPQIDFNLESAIARGVPLTNRIDKNVHRVIGGLSYCIFCFWMLALPFSLISVASLCPQHCPFNHHCDEINGDCRCNTEDEDPALCQICELLLAVLD